MFPRKTKEAKVKRTEKIVENKKGKKVEKKEMEKGDKRAKVVQPSSVVFKGRRPKSINEDFVMVVRIYIIFASHTFKCI